MKPFDLEAAKNGAPVCLQDGRPVRIICFDRFSDAHPIVGLIMEPECYESIGLFNTKGQCMRTADLQQDLYMAPRIHEGWVIVRIYPLAGSMVPSISRIYDTEAEAQECITPGRHHATIFRIKWEE